MIHTYNGILFDSREEVHFAMWLDELIKEKYVFSWKRCEPINIFNPLKLAYWKETKLKTKIKREIKEYTLLHGLSYTPDFEICWSVAGLIKFVSSLQYPRPELERFTNPNKWFFGDISKMFVEVKPTFDMHQKTDKFSIIQKTIWNTQKIFIDLIIPEKLFEGTFMPEKVMEEYKYKNDREGKWKKGDWKCDFVPKTLKEFLDAK